MPIGNLSDETSESDQPQPKRRKTDALPPRHYRPTGRLFPTMETRQTPVAPDEGSAPPDSPELIFPLPPSASQPPPTHSQAAQPLPHATAYTRPFDYEPAVPAFSPTPSPAYDSAMEQRVHLSGEGRVSPVSCQRTIAPQGSHPVAIPTGDTHIFLSHLVRPPSLPAARSSRSVVYDSLQSSDIPGAIAMVNNLAATSSQAWTAWTSEPLAVAFPTPLPISNRITPVRDSIRDAESRQVDGQNQESVQPGFPEQQSSHPWKPLQQRDHRLVPAGPQLQLATQWRVPDTAQSIAFALNGNIDGLKDLFSRGLASPWDVSDSRGFSLIRVGFTTPFSLECALKQR